MRRVGLLIIALAAASGALLSAHLKVDRTLPATGGTIATAPKQLQVWFTEMPTLAVSALVLEGPSGKAELGKLALGKINNEPDKSIVADVVSALAPGKYKVSWRTSGADGHMLTGTFEFTLKALH
jgi:methionine-rich copper-binding protein CopC